MNEYEYDDDDGELPCPSSAVYGGSFGGAWASADYPPFSTLPGFGSCEPDHIPFTSPLDWK